MTPSGLLTTMVAMRRALPSVLLFGLIACRKDTTPPPPPPGVSSASENERASPEAKTATGGEGEGDEEQEILPGWEGLGPRHELAVATEELSQCHLRGSMFDIEKTCEHYSTWKEAVPSIRTITDDEEAIDVTFIRMLYSDDVAVRRAAAFTLNRAGIRYRVLPELADAILDAAAAETDPFTAKMLGEICGSMFVMELDRLDRITKLAHEHPVPEFRRALAGSVLFPRKKPEIYALTVSMFDDPDQETKLAAINALWVGTPDEMDAETCAAWRRAGEGQDPKIVYKALDLVIRKPCRSDHAWVLDQIEARIQADTAGTYEKLLLRSLKKEKYATPAHVERATKLSELLKSKQ